MSGATTSSIRKLKGQRPIVCVAAYDTIFASIADSAGVDLILVGDSMGTTFLGFPSTVPVTLEMIAHHTAAVSRAHPQALIVADIPFALASMSFDRLLEGCAHLMQNCGAAAVKIEGGQSFAPTIARLVDAGVPVLGHIGLLPQRINELGSYRSYGKTEAGAQRLIKDALALQEAGAFAIVGEMIAADTSRKITQELTIPFIGIGCGPDCDGQILVISDILGLTLGGYPSFSKQYANIAKAAREALSAYTDDVRQGRFPQPTISANS